VRRLLLAMTTLLLCVRGAAADRAGPELADVLGWDPKLQRVYVDIVHTDGSEYTPSLWYFDLRSERPATPMVVDWSGGEEDDLYAKRIKALEKRLRPLRVDERTWSMVDDVVSVPAFFDSVESDVGHEGRYVALCHPEFGSSESFRVFTLDPSRHAVRRLRQYSIPGTKAKLAILSCESKPEETGYEIQFPVLLGAGPVPADPINPRAFDVRR